jgi:large subunit ribosomal protein L17
MRHAKHTFKIGRTGSHRRAMIANMLKSLIQHGRIETTLTKGKEIKRYADKMITLAKKNTLASRRLAASKMQLRYNTLTAKEARLAKQGDKTVYNDDRVVIGKLFGELREKYAERQGGYTRVIRSDIRIGDSAEKCYVEYI